MRNGVSGGVGIQKRAQRHHRRHKPRSCCPVSHFVTNAIVRKKTPLQWRKIINFGTRITSFRAFQLHAKTAGGPKSVTIGVGYAKILEFGRFRQQDRSDTAVLFADKIGTSASPTEDSNPPPLCYPGSALCIREPTPRNPARIQECMINRTLAQKL